HDRVGDEDDWFATPGTDPFDSDTIVWEDPEPERPPRRRPSPLAGPWIAIAALVGAVVLIVGGILLAQSLTDSDGSSATPTTSVPTTPTTPATTPTTTTTDTTDTTPATTTEPSTGDITLPEGVKLRSGDSGSGVEAVQRALAKLGYDPGAIDGDFGPATEAAVVAFQTAEGLSADGVVGTDTLNALAAALSTG
ncbi:MAG: peptidoglycan-binding protein, partial [Thermoleophilia bacterium]|nr:peptidoglycan-binding protein [Thermoleophilia bacterium]